MRRILFLGVENFSGAHDDAVRVISTRGAHQFVAAQSTRHYNKHNGHSSALPWLRDAAPATASRRHDAPGAS